MLKEIISLFDDKLEAAYNAVVHDGAKAREAMAKRIDKTKEKFLQTEPARGKKDYTIKNNVVAYSPTRHDGSPLMLNGRATNHTPSERFVDVLDKLKAAVLGGHLDKELTADAPAGATDKPARAPRKPRDPNTPAKAGWSDERRAKFAATVAARNATK